MDNTDADSAQAPKTIKIRRVDFYPADWITGTAGMQADEIGVYITICALIYAEGGPRPDDEKRIAALAGLHWRAFRRVRSELKRRGKIVAEDGQITVRRCAEELQRARKRAAEASQNGAKGNEIRWSAVATRSDAATANNQQSSINTHQTTERNARESPRASFAAEFDQWWEAYPHKVGKGAARTAFQKARRSGADPQHLLHAIQTYVRNKPADRPWCNPATWLNQERWNDEHDRPKPTVSGPPSPRTPPPKV
jgi:uncharacterized protein YdaU (DUF1376 family)